MKIHTLITNEQGKQKGLAGNEYLDIDVKVGNQIIATFTLRRDISPEDENYEAWVVFDQNDEPVRWLQDDKPIRD